MGMSYVKVFRQTYYTRGTLHLERTPAIIDLARQCRGLFANGGMEEEIVDKWEKEVFTPHVSLVYSAMDPVPDNIRKAIGQDLKEANIGVLHWDGPKGEMRGWKGGRITLVEVFILRKCVAKYPDNSDRSRPINPLKSGRPWLRERCSYPGMVQGATFLFG